MKELCLEERLLDYSKYYYWKMPQPDPLALQISDAPVDSAKVLPAERMEKMLDPGYHAVEHGYCIMPNGSAFVACYVNMPGVTVDMIDWWFVWHFITPPSVPSGNGNLRYKLWCPSAHWETGLVDEASMKRYLDDRIPLRERRQGTEAYIVEAIVEDQPPCRMTAHAVFNEEFGLDMNKLNKPENGTITGAVVVSDGVPAIHFQQYRPTVNGIELRARYWLGYRLENGKAVRAYDCPNPTEESARAILLHNMKECPHLAHMLPSLYAEESGKPVDVY